MARLTKCPICELSFNRDKCEFVHHKNRYYHKVCYDSMLSAKAQEEKDLAQLEEYIMKMFKETYVNARVRKQIKSFKEQYNFSYTGMLKSLIYFYEIKGNSIEKANGGIGIIPYVYKDAFDYYYSLHLAQERNKDKDVSQYVTEGKSIKIKSPKLQPKQKRLFNMEEE